MSDASLRLPLFPLMTVLYPGSLLPLKIFEARYLDMVSASLRERRPFGIVPIRHGREVGAAAAFYPLGTLATIDSFDRGEDGLLHLRVLGTERVRVVGHSVQSDGLTLGDVVPLPSVSDCIIPEDLNYLRSLLQEVYERNAASIPYSERHWQSASWLAYRLAELLPLPVTTRLGILEADDADTALRIVDSALRALSDPPPRASH